MPLALSPAVMGTSLSGLLSLLAPIWLSGVPPGAPGPVLEHEGRILLGTERGLYRASSGGWESVLARGPVLDLASGTGAVWIAAADGLYAWPPGVPSPRAVSIAAGARVRAVAVSSDGRVLVATEVGLFVRGAAGGPFARERGLPLGVVRGVRETPDGIWAAARGGIWVQRAGEPFRPVLRDLEAGWWELRDAVATEGGTVLCVPRGLWHVGRPGEDRANSAARDGAIRGDATQAQRVTAPGLGTLHGLALRAGRLWVASERGVAALELARPEAAERVVDGPAIDVAPVRDGLLVTTQRGVARLVVASSLPGLALRAASEARPDVRALQRAVLAYLELGPARVARLEARARRAALWPELRASFSLDRERGREQQRDQTFSAGDVRDLLDHSSDHEGGLSLTVQLTWDLESLEAPTHALAISRERRALIELRDQVLDRVNHLYFEHLRLRARLADAAMGSAAERRELELRAAELAARLDAWSGGMFSRLRKDSPPAIRRP